MTDRAPPPPTKAHHTADGFRNNYPHPPKQSFWKWQRERREKHLPPAPPPGGWNIPVVPLERARIAHLGEDPQATWIGHVTFLVQLAGLNILVDPHFSARASPLPFAGPKRIVPLPIGIDELPCIDVVLITHNHYDHLDRGSVKALARRFGPSLRFLVPLGLDDWFAREGISTTRALDWWERMDVEGVRFHFVPAQHWSARTPWDANRTLWGGWVMEHVTGDIRILHTGDTGYSRDFVDIGTRLGPFDLAMIPIGAYAPRWFMRAQHVDPEEAVQMHLDLKARQSVAMHWGTFDRLTDEPMDEPPKRLAAELRRRGLPADAFRVMAIGETLALPRRR